MVRQCILGVSMAVAVGATSVPAPAFAHDEGKTVALESIPAAARQAILREANGAPILKVEEEQGRDRTLYEAQVKKGNDRVGIVVDAKGTLIGTHPEKGEKKKK